MKTNLTSEYLESMRQVTDEVADKAVLAVIETSPEKEKAILNLFNQLAANDDEIPQGLPPVLQDYFDQTATLPTWADPKLIEKGEQLFSLYGPEFVLNLFCKSLPEAYSCANGAQVLYHTGRLNVERNNGQDLNETYNAYNRRIMETAQFILNVMAPGGLSDKGKGVRTAQKVRLIHASIRHYLKNSGQWNMQWGEPINQEDMAGTLMTFSIEIIDGAQKLSIKLSPEEQEAYLHAWRVVGHLIGLKSELIPDNVNEARELRNMILDQQAAASPQGQQLLKALVGYMNYMSPSRIFYPIPEFLIRYLIGKRLADILAVKPENFFGYITLFFFKVTFGLFALVERPFGFIRKITARLSRKIIQAMVTDKNHNKPINFWVPPSLKDDWKIK